jgi:hypothetical protein
MLRASIGWLDSLIARTAGILEEGTWCRSGWIVGNPSGARGSGCGLDSDPVVHRYHLLQKIGEGGMGEVFSCALFEQTV